MKFVLVTVALLGVEAVFRSSDRGVHALTLVAVEVKVAKLGINVKLEKRLKCWHAREGDKLGCDDWMLAPHRSILTLEDDSVFFVVACTESWKAGGFTQKVVASNSEVARIAYLRVADGRAWDW